MSRTWVCLLLALVACKSKEAPPPAAAPPAPVAPIEKALPARSEAAITFVEDRAEGCAWVEEDPTTERRRELWSTPGSCGDLVWAFSVDVKRGAVVRRMEGVGHELSIVDLETLEVEKMPAPPKDGFAGIGFDKSGALIALVEEIDSDGTKIPRVTVEEQSFYEVDGKRYDIAQDGSPGLAHAYRLEGGAWKKFQTVSSSFEWDYAAGASALPITKELGVRAPVLGIETSAWKEIPEGADTIKKLGQSAPRKPDQEGEWIEIATGTTALYAWAEASEFMMSTAELYRLKGDRAQRFDVGLPPETLVHYATKGRYLLINDYDRHVKLYDTRSGKALLDKTGASAAIFWPAPG